MVGKTGFEPATPWSQTKCSTKLSHFPIYGALEGIRTPDLLVRSQTLYPTELRAHIQTIYITQYKSNSPTKTLGFSKTTIILSSIFKQVKLLYIIFNYR